MTFSMHREASQFVSGGPRRLVMIVRCLCAVLALQLSTGFATAQQNIPSLSGTPPTSPLPNQNVEAAQQTPVEKGSRDLLKDEVKASQEIQGKEASHGSGQALLEAGFPETPKGDGDGRRGW